MVVDFPANSLGAQELSYLTDRALAGGVVSSLKLAWAVADVERSFEGQAALLGTGALMSRTPPV